MYPYNLPNEILLEMLIEGMRDLEALANGYPGIAPPDVEVEDDEIELLQDQIRNQAITIAHYQNADNVQKRVIEELEKELEDAPKLRDPEVVAEGLLTLVEHFGKIAVENDELQTKLYAADDETGMFLSEIEKLKLELAQAKSKNTDLLFEKSQLEVTIAQIREHYDSKLSQFADLQDKYDNLERMTQQYSDYAVSAAQDMQNALKAEIEEMQETINEQNRTIMNRNRTINELEALSYDDRDWSSSSC